MYILCFFLGYCLWLHSLLCTLLCASVSEFWLIGDRNQAIQCHNLTGITLFCSYLERARFLIMGEGVIRTGKLTSCCTNKGLNFWMSKKPVTNGPQSQKVQGDGTKHAHSFRSKFSRDFASDFTHLKFRIYDFFYVSREIFKKPQI